MNDDCLFVIFEQMELDQLVNMTQVNARFYNLARNVFKRMYSHHIRINRLDNAPKISIMGQWMEYQFGSHALGVRTPVPYNGRASIKFDGIVQIFDYHLLLNTFRYFGDVIQSFEIQGGGIEPNVLKNLYAHISKYCASTLVRLDLGIFKDKRLETLTGPFTNLEELILDISHKIRTVKISLSEKFPNLRRLTLTNWKRQQALLILDGQLPYLEYLNIESAKGGSEHLAFDGFLQQNPTIRQLRVSHFSKDYIETIHRLLPSLEHLTIDGGLDQNEIVDPIHFEHLKVFHYRTYRPKSLTKISFSHLEELLMYYDRESYYQWIEFFRMNHTFTRFYVDEDFDAIDFEQNIQRIVNALPPSAIDITMNSYSGLDIKTITKIIQSRDNLMTLQYSTPNDIDDIEDELTTTFGKSWNITIPPNRYSWNQILFVRKHSTTLE